MSGLGRGIRNGSGSVVLHLVRPLLRFGAKAE